MKKMYVLLLSLPIALGSMAQKNGTVKGVAFDSNYKRPIELATVSLLEKKDSSLVSFTMTDNAGRFEFKNIRNGEYRLLITHVNYHNNNQLFTLGDHDKEADLGNIIMNDRSKTLNEVVVQTEAPPVTLINDTVQYNAGSFKTAPNANVEQLLKKLPGVKVDKDGTIKAQGEKVNRVLVDGKEFFGSDPKIATKNLPADAVDKVQVYDRQSDQAQLTGFDDGNYEKTINLKLKKDKKKGMFGKVSIGAGTNERYEGKFNINSFKGARQVSAIGMGNNSNAEGFSFMDILNFTGELNRMQRNNGGNLNINISGDDAAAMGAGGNRDAGIKTAWGGGVNYNNIIGTKVDLQSNYFYNRYNPNTESHIQRQYFLPDSSYFFKQNSFVNNLNNNHRLNLNALYQADSMNSIRVTPSFTYQETNNRSQNDYQTMGENKTMTNEGFSNNSAANAGYNFRNDLAYRRKINRRGRTLSLSLQTSINKSNGNGALSSINKFYNPDGTLFKKDTINQQSNTAADLSGYTARIVYTEPLFRRSLLEFSAGKSYTRNNSEKITYDYNKLNGKHDQLNDQLTNDFKNDYGYTNAGIRVRTQKRKYNYSFGATWQQATLEGKVITGVKDSLISKTFTNILPNARFQYNFSRFRRFSFNYAASTTQPDMSQLQPVTDNSNSLNIKEGNPNLKQEYTHNIQSNLEMVSPYKNKNLFFFFNMQATQNKIVNYDSISSLGVKTTKPVNVNGVYNLNGSISYAVPVRFLKASVEISSNVNYYNGKQFINRTANNIMAFSLGPELRLDMNPHNKLNVSLSAALNYNNTKYSLQAALNTTYFQQEYSSSIDWEMPKRFFFSTDFSYTINSQRAAGFNSKVPLWNASISKQMLKYNRGEIKLSAVDILNRNIGISRNSNQNYIEDSRVKTLRQFFMLSFTYSLSKTGLNNAGNGGMRVIAR
ncbi:MAG: outer membrane beta-barrel protein [Ferruginibacter sp.]